MSPARRRLITLRTTENQEFVVEESVILQSEVIKDMLECLQLVDDTIPLEFVKSRTLAMVLDFCKKHADLSLTDEELKVYDSEFVEKPESDIYELFTISNYLRVQKLMDLMTQRIVRMFNLGDDFTLQDVLLIVDENMRRLAQG